MSEIESVLKKNPLWGEVKEILQSLHKKGWEAVLAGGGVRDALLGLTPKDFDVAVSVRPEEVLKLFPKAKDSWKRYGVVFLSLSKKGYTVEITTFRKDNFYEDGRHPSSVEYTSIEEDAKRRDFTVNGLFYDIKKDQVLDFVQGLEDLKSGTLRTVGNPQNRFEEDQLRPLRALRFAHQLNFIIEPKTGEAVSSFANRLQTVSKERIYNELLKMFSYSPFSRAVKILKDYSFFDVLFPFKIPPEGDPLLFWSCPFSFYKEPAFLWAVLGLPYFYRTPGKVQGFLKENFKAPGSVSNKAAEYIRGVSVLFSEASFTEKLKAFNIGKNQIRELAHNFSKIQGLSSQKIEELFKEFENRETEQGFLPDPLVTGEDLLKAGYSSGPEMGELLKKAFAYQIEKKVLEKEEVLRYLITSEKA